jgi:hypothetical protein
MRNTVYQNITGPAYQLNAEGITLHTEEGNLAGEQRAVRIQKVSRLITKCVQAGERAKQCLRDSLVNLNDIGHLPFEIFRSAFLELLQSRVLSPARDGRLIGSMYRIFAEFHDPVAEDGDAEVRAKLEAEGEKYSPLSAMGRWGKMLKGGRKVTRKGRKGGRRGRTARRRA